MIPDRTRPVPLSQTQSGIYISTLQSEQATIYHIPQLNFFPAVDDADRLAEAVRTLVDAYPVLSAVITTDADGVPVMYRDPDSTVEVERLATTERELQAS